VGDLRGLVDAHHEDVQRIRQTIEHGVYEMLSGPEDDEEE
jgi:hypothetical protein